MASKCIKDGMLRDCVIGNRRYDVGAEGGGYADNLGADRGDATCFGERSIRDRLRSITVDE